MEAFLEKVGIVYLTPESGDEYYAHHDGYTGPQEQAQPAIITIPESSEQAAAIVKQCIAANAAMVVRGAGHDCHGRYAAAGAVTIDLRKLDFVEIAPDKKTVRVGGGVTASRVHAVLGENGLAVPSGVCGLVGFTSWCLVGGLGPWSSLYGIGSDQIVGARVINAKGELVQADERLLKGLRGGGGSLVVVVELVVKAYPQVQIQQGTFVYDGSDMGRIMSTFFTNFDKLLQGHPALPAQLCIQPLFVPFGPMGHILAADYVWTGEATDESRAWVDRVANLAPLMPGTPEPHVTVKTVTSSIMVDTITEALPLRVRGNTQAVSVTHYSPQVVEILAKAASNFPEKSAIGFNIHTIRRESPSCSSNIPDSVAPYRKPQVVFEIMGFALDDEGAPAAMEWAYELRRLLMDTDAALPSSYLPLTAPEFVELDKIYGDKLKDLRELKSEYDPRGVFKNTLPKLV